jgi:hypothetical protein
MALVTTATRSRLRITYTDSAARAFNMTDARHTAFAAMVVTFRDAIAAFQSATPKETFFITENTMTEA